MINKDLYENVQMIIGKNKDNTAYSLHENHNYMEKDNNEWIVHRSVSQGYNIRVKTIEEGVEILKSWGDNIFTLVIRIENQVL